MKILIAGDVCPTSYTDPLFKKQDVDTLFGDVASIFEGNNINLVNLECALGSELTPIKKIGPNLLACPETAQTLKKLGVNLCGISNNHFFDYGKRGAIESISALKDAGIDYVGFGENYEDSRKNFVVEKNGEKVCFIAVCEHEFSYALDDRMGCRPFDPFDTIWDIRHAKEKCDRVIVIYHGGKEYSMYPSPRVRKAFHAMAKNGADVIIGQHSHCICCYEQVEGAHLLYGQGNFHFVSSTPHTSEWYSAIEFKYDSLSNTVEFIPTVHSVGDLGITLAKGEKKESIIAEFNKRNESLLDGSWIDGWRDFVREKQDYYKKVIKRTYSWRSTKDYEALFGHFLECESHADVWRELFPSANLTNEK